MDSGGGGDWGAVVYISYSLSACMLHLGSEYSRMPLVVEVACGYNRGYIFREIPGGAVRSACVLHQDRGSLD